MIMADLNKAQIGAENAKIVADYLEKHGAGDLTNLSRHTLPIYNGRVNKSAIAEELGIGRSVWSQNPRCRAMIEAIEKALGAGTTPSKATHSGTDLSVHELERRVQWLEGRNAALVAENAGLRAELRKMGWIETTLPETGRLPW
jgi:hypothetical protein